MPYGLADRAAAVRRLGDVEDALHEAPDRQPATSAGEILVVEEEHVVRAGNEVGAADDERAEVPNGSTHDGERDLGLLAVAFQHLLGAHPNVGENEAVIR